MGQKANPTSLRLKKTNQSFNSCWYSDIYYSKLISQEFRAKQYLSNIFNQIKYPHPHLSFSLLPKKIKAMTIYLNPIESRYRRCERFQLKLVQGTSSIASHVSRRTGSLHCPDLLLTDIGQTSLQEATPSGPPSIYNLSKIGTTNHLLLPTAIDARPLGNAARENRFFVHRLLLSIAIRKGIGERLAWRKDFELFQKLHRLTWFQGREESSSFLCNKQQPITNDRRSEYRHTKIELAVKRRSKNRRDSSSTRFFHTLRSTTYNTSQTLQNLGSTKVISGNNIGSERREFSTFFDSRVFAPCSSLPITAITCRNQVGADQRSAILRCAQDRYKDCSPLPILCPSSMGSGRHKINTSRCSASYLASYSASRSSQVKSKTSDHHQMNTGIPSDGLGTWQGVQKGHPRHQQNLSPKLPFRSKDHIHVNLLESTIEKGVGCSINLCFYKSTEDGQAASFLSEEIAYYLERRVPFRRIKQLLLRELRTNYIEGVRVSCSGRVGGRSKKAQRARGEKFQWGQTSSHVFSSRLAFASRSALTSFGKVGIKVWICYK